MSNLPINEIEKNLKTHAIISYALMLMGILSGGLLSLAGVIWAYVKRGDAQDTFVASHFANIIRTFWIAVALTVVAFLTYMFGIGVFIVIGVAIYCLYRYVKGLIRLIDNREIA